MELVYLWVDKYKNIRNQGFNFSPKFTCNYNEKSHNLTIEHKEHIKNLFDEKGNINITAIVGENGSGKSSILEDVLDSFISIDYELFSNKNLLIYCYKGKLYKKHSSEFIIKDISKEININTITNKNNNPIIDIENLNILTIIDKSIKTIIYKDNFTRELKEKEYTENYINKIIIINTQHKSLFNEIADNFFLPLKLTIKVRGNILKNYANRDKKFKKARLAKIDELEGKSLFEKIKVIIEIFQNKNEGIGVVT